MQRGEEEVRRGDSNLQRCANAVEGEAREEGQEAGGIDESGWFERGTLHYFKKPVPRSGRRSAKEANEWRAAIK